MKLREAMDKKSPRSRDLIIEKADRLFYTKGYNQTSFADIAQAVGITKGNLHYHFRSKEELLDTIIDYRLVMIAELLAQWNTQYSGAKDKLRRFVQMLLNEEADLVRYGCPMGSLNVELGKDQQALQAKSREMFDLFQIWLENTFKQLGKKNSKILSKHLLAMAQGAVLMSYVYSDGKLLKNECREIIKWIDSL